MLTTIKIIATILDVLMLISVAFFHYKLSKPDKVAHIGFTVMELGYLLSIYAIWGR